MNLEINSGQEGDATAWTSELKKLFSRGRGTGKGGVAAPSRCCVELAGWRRNYSNFMVLWAIVSRVWLVLSIVELTKTEDSTGVSLPAYVFIVVGSLAWFVYGFAVLSQVDYAIVVGSFLSFILAIIMLCLIQKYAKKAKRRRSGKKSRKTHGRRRRRRTNRIQVDT